MKKIYILAVLTAILCLGISGPAQVSTGGTYTMVQTTISNSGGSLAGGTFAVDNTVGPSPIGGPLFGFPYGLSSGFWNFSAIATGPPTIAKGFGASSIPLNGSTTLAFTINNPNTVTTLTGVTFADALPAGLVVSTPNGLTGSCGGGVITATAGSGSISLTGASLAPLASCTFSANVTGTTAGVKNNSVQANSTEGGLGNTASASLTVVAPPVIIKAFGAATIPLNSSTSLTFTVQNNNTTTALNGVGFTDTLPAGLIVSTPNGLAGTCGGGTITAAAGSGSVSLTGATLASSSQCSFSVNVTGTTAGVKNNTTGNVTSTNGGAGGTASASVTVIAPPTIAKAFGAAAILLNGSTSLTFTLTNPAGNTVPLTGVGFGDNFPAGLLVSTPNGLSAVTGCGGGTVTATAGSGSASLSGATIAVGGTCTFAINVTGTTPGAKNNVTANVTSANGGTGSTATANLAVDAPPTAVANTTNIVTAPATLYTFTVTYADDIAVNVATLDSSDVRVTGPNGYNAAATFTGVDVNTNGTPRVATYTVVPPGGGWDIGDNGTYNVVMQAAQVNDTSAQSVVAGTIGSFTVNIPPVSISGNIRQFITGGPGDPPLSGVTVAISSPNVPVPGSVQTDASGNFSFAGLSTGGSYVLTPSGFGKVYDPITRTYPSVISNVAGANFFAYDPNNIPRTIKVVDTVVPPGQAVAVPVVMTSMGTEKSVSFSVNYNTNVLANNPSASCGTSAPGCTVTFNNATPGKIGVTVTAAGIFNAGPREVAEINFQTLPNNLPSVPVTFGDTPTARLVTDASNNPLPVALPYGDGRIVFAQGFEGDVASRNTGDGQLLPGDVTVERQFVVGSLTPDPSFNEFQRADTTPANTGGDGQLDATDIIQLRRYVAALDPVRPATGLNSPPQPVLTVAPAPEVNVSAKDAGGRTLRAGSADATPGEKVTVPIELDVQGGEVAASFTLSFNRSRLLNPVVELGPGTAEDTVLTANAANGKLGVLVDASVPFTTKLTVNVTFDVAPDARGGAAALKLTDAMAHRSTSDMKGNPLPTHYEDGVINISGPASNGFEISGMVLTPEGRGLRNARVTIVDQNGNNRAVITSASGMYRFDGIEAGVGYTLSVSSRLYRYGPRTVVVTDDDVFDIDFVGSE